MSVIDPLDLSRRRDIGALLSDGFALWRAHLPILFTLALLVVAPVRLLVDGLWARTITEWSATPAPAPGVVSGLCGALLIPVLVTAAHVVTVLDIAEGRSPALGDVLRRSARVAGPVAVVVLLYLGAVALGTVVLIVPGIWLSVRLYFGAQAAVIDGGRGVDALRRSSALVDGQWWRAFGTLLVIGIAAAVLGALVALAIGAPVALLTDAGALVAALNLAGEAVTQSFTALVSTLFFFDLRAGQAIARRDEPASPAATYHGYAPPGPP